MPWLSHVAVIRTGGAGAVRRIRLQTGGASTAPQVPDVRRPATGPGGDNAARGQIGGGGSPAVRPPQGALRAQTSGSPSARLPSIELPRFPRPARQSLFGLSEPQVHFPGPRQLSVIGVRAALNKPLPIWRARPTLPALRPSRANRKSRTAPATSGFAWYAPRSSAGK